MRQTILNKILVMSFVFVATLGSSEHGASDVLKTRSASYEDSVCQRIKDFYMAYQRQDELNYTEYFSPERLDLLKKHCTKRLYDIQIHEIEYSDGYDIVTDNVRRSIFNEADIEVRKDSDFYQVRFNVRDGIPLIKIYMKGDSIDRVVNPNRFLFEEQPSDVMTYSKVECPVRTSQLRGTRWREVSCEQPDEWEFDRSVIRVYRMLSYGEKKLWRFKYYIYLSHPYLFDVDKVGTEQKGVYLVVKDREDGFSVYRIVFLDKKKGEMMLRRYRNKDEIGCGTLDRETYIRFRRIK